MIRGKKRWFHCTILLTLAAGYTLTGCQNVVQNVGASPSPESSGELEIPVSTATSTALPLPTPTQTPPLPPTLIPQLPPATRAPLPCLDDLALVLDLSLGAGEEHGLPLLPLGSPIEKGWRVRNTGTCTWDSAYTLALQPEYLDWAQPNQPIAVNGSVKPGGVYEFWVALDPPLSPGIYQAEWALKNSRGETVGERLELGVEVTSLAAETPLPDVSLIASPLEVLRGEDVRIAWTTNEAKAAYFYPAGLAWREHPVQVNGSTIVEPDKTTTYELRVVKGDDSVEIRRITIEVVPFDPPKIQSLEIKPDNEIDQGQCVDIVWLISGRVHEVTVLRNGAYFWETQEESGNIFDCPEISGDYTYTLQALGPGGIDEAKRTLHVR